MVIGRLFIKKKRKKKLYFRFLRWQLTIYLIGHFAQIHTLQFHFRSFNSDSSKMPLKLQDATVSDFNAVFDKFRSELPNNKANFILFLADKDPSTSLSWCPGTPILFYFFVFSPLFLILLKIFFFIFLWMLWLPISKGRW